MEWVASTLHTNSEHGVSSITTADAHTSAASRWLNWRPRRFKRTRPFRRKMNLGFCACAITFQTQSTRNIFWGVKAGGAYSWRQTYHFHVPTAYRSWRINILEASGLVQCFLYLLPLRDKAVALSYHFHRGKNSHSGYLRNASDGVIHFTLV